MRARNIKPGFASDKNLLKCSTPAHLLFPMLWMMADREGRLEDDPEQIALDSFFVVRGLDCDPLLAELADRKLITRYTVKGKNYIQINRFEDHQNPHKNETASVIPPLVDTLREHSSNGASTRDDSLIDDSLIDDSNTPLTPQKIGGESGEKRFIPPSVEEVSEYCESRQNGIDPQEFVAFYASKGWMVGKNKMKDWRAAIWTWEKKRARENPKPVQEKPEDYSRYLDAIRAQQ